MGLLLCSYILAGLLVLSFLRMALAFETIEEAFNHVFEKGTIAQLAFWPIFGLLYLGIKWFRG